MLPSPQLMSATLTGRSRIGAVSGAEGTARKFAAALNGRLVWADSALLIAASRAVNLMGLESVNLFSPGNVSIILVLTRGLSTIVDS